MKRVDLITQINVELQHERVSSLTRVGNKLKSHIDRAAALALSLDGLPPGPEREKLLAAYESARQDAETYHYYLVVQREAMGLRDHRIVDETYPLPKRIRA